MKTNNLIKIISLWILLLSGCAITSLYEIKPEYGFYGIDFSKYSKEGFLITPEKYTGKYESVGMVEYRLMPGAKYLAVGNYRDASGKIQATYKWFIDKIEFSQAIDSIYVMAKSMGADAITNFDSEIEIKQISSLKYNNPVTITGYRITGYAIKRLEE